MTDTHRDRSVPPSTPAATSPDPGVVVTIYHDDESEEWVVGDDGGEFDDECYTGDEAEGSARHEAALRFAYCQGEGREVSQEQL